MKLKVQKSLIAECSPIEMMRGKYAFWRVCAGNGGVIRVNGIISEGII
jgi:hypothetical protein